MISDLNKGITSIIYNHLNLSTQINFENGNKIQYLYDATGKKVEKKVFYTSGSMVTEYLDGFQYTDEKLSFFPHAEGYVNVTFCATCEVGSQNKFNYVYQYKDHLEGGALKKMPSGHF